MSTSDLISFYKQLIQNLENGELNQRQIQTLIKSKRISNKNLMKQRFKYDHCYQAAAEGDLDELKLMHQAGFSIDSAADEAASNGYLDCLKYAHENGCKLTDATAFAAGNGHLDCLKYAFENGCKIDSDAIRYAARGGHLDCLRFSYENFNYESQYNINKSENEKKWTEDWNNEWYATTHAARNGHLDCLKFARENGCPWNETTTELAALNGELECLKFAHENGCHWNENTILEAVEQLKPYNESFWYDEEDINEAKEKRYYKYQCNILDCLRYAIENGCPYDTENEIVMNQINQLKNNIETTKNIIKKVELNDNVVDHIINKYI